MIIASGYIAYRYNGYHDQHKNFVILWHPTILSRGHRCFAFHYVMLKAMEKHAGWGFSARVKMNGKIYSEVVPTNASGEWHLGKMDLPRLEGVPMQIEFQACSNCFVGLDNFIFSYQSCKSGQIRNVYTMFPIRICSTNFRLVVSRYF